jgi:hypothetical protein
MVNTWLTQTEEGAPFTRINQYILHSLFPPANRTMKDSIYNHNIFWEPYEIQTKKFQGVLLFSL